MLTVAFLQHLNILKNLYFTVILKYVTEFTTFKIYMLKKITILTFYLIIGLNLISCGNGFFKGGDARKNPPEPQKRVAKNLTEGKGFRLADKAKNLRGGGNFEFASSNELWRASLDAIDFMPLVSANYSGGIIITDWYSDSGDQNETIKITIRFLSNEIRSDSLDITVFIKNCKSLSNCKITETQSQITNELRKKILKDAVKYSKARIDSNKRKTPYIVSEPSRPSD